MRGNESKQASMLCLLSPESRVPAKHPIRKLKAIADAALKRLEPTFAGMYSDVGRPSVPPETLLKSALLIALYSVRSERMFCEQLQYNLLFRWFLDMDMDQDGFDHSSFSQNRLRLMQHDVARKFLAAVVAEAQAADLMSDEHFCVDGSLIEAWASLKSFRKKDSDDDDSSGGDGNRWVNFHGEKRSNDTHESKTDPDARLMRKGLGKEAKLSFAAHLLMENRHGLLRDVEFTHATGTAERDAAARMLRRQPGNKRITVGADRGYDTRGFVDECRSVNVTPHVAQNTSSRRSAIDERTTGRAGYRISQRIRMRIEEIFGWMKTVANFRKTKLRGLEKNHTQLYLVAAAYNLLRMSKLLSTTA